MKIYNLDAKLSSSIDRLHIFLLKTVGVTGSVLYYYEHSILNGLPHGKTTTTTNSMQQVVCIGSHSSGISQTYTFFGKEWGKTVLEDLKYVKPFTNLVH